MHRRGFTAGSLTRVGTREGTRGQEIEVGFEEELMEVRRMVEDHLGGGELLIGGREVRQQNGVTLF